VLERLKALRDLGDRPLESLDLLERLKRQRLRLASQLWQSGPFGGGHEVPRTARGRNHATMIGMLLLINPAVAGGGEATAMGIELA